VTNPMHTNYAMSLCDGDTSTQANKPSVTNNTRHSAVPSDSELTEIKWIH